MARLFTGGSTPFTCFTYKCKGQNHVFAIDYNTNCACSFLKCVNISEILLLVWHCFFSNCLQNCFSHLPVCHERWKRKHMHNIGISIEHKCFKLAKDGLIIYLRVSVLSFLMCLKSIVACEKLWICLLLCSYCYCRRCNGKSG